MTETTYKAQNGPFDDGPDKIWIQAESRDEAKRLIPKVTDFTSTSIEEVSELPGDAVEHERVPVHPQSDETAPVYTQ